jgi:branched-chain amino acid transport system ATP-binding protein
VSAPAALLSLEDLDVRYGVIQALHGISLHVDPGEIVTLIGANGAGKSTTLLAVSGLLRPSAGRIVFDGADVTAWAPHRRVAGGVVQVPEGRRVFANMSVLENLELGAYVRRDRAGVKKDLQRMMDYFPILAERRAQRAGTLSGGEQQMLAMARALMGRPRLLLLDEPSLGLAPLVVRKVFEIIRDINRDGTTVFLVEQNAHMALGIAHRGYVLQTGRILLADRTEALLQHPDVKRAYLGG